MKLKQILIGTTVAFSLILDPYFAIAKPTPVEPRDFLQEIFQPAQVKQKGVRHVRNHHRRHHRRHSHSSRHVAHHHRSRQPAKVVHKRETAPRAVAKHEAPAPTPPVLTAFDDIGIMVLEIPKLAIEAIKNTSQAMQDAVELELARQYLIQTATPGATMTRQGVRLSIERLHPVFVRRLAAAIKEARLTNQRVGIGSAYRPPGYRIGGFRDKFESAHAYGLAVDMAGLDGAGGRKTKAFHQIAKRYGVWGVYGPNNRAESNHFQIVRYTMVARVAPLRRTITARAPINEVTMWSSADRIIDKGPTSVQGGRRHYARRHHHHVRMASR